MPLSDAIFNAVFTGFFFLGSIAALVLGLTAPTHDPAAASVAGLGAGGGLFGTVLLAAPFFNALEDLWWSMGYSSGMLFSGRCERRWSDKHSPAAWRDLLRARNLAAALFVQAYLPNPRWLYWVLGCGVLAATTLAAVAVFALAALPGNAPILLLAYAALGFDLAFALSFAGLLGVHRLHFRQAEDPPGQNQAIEIIGLLGGWAHLGRRLAIDCAGSDPLILGFGVTTTTIFTAALSFASGVALKLWPYRGFLAAAVAAGILLLALAVAVWRHLQAMYQALHPERYSPCVSLPLTLLLRDAAKRRDRGVRFWRD